ncbi:N-acetylmuramic acid 6-phosphate etherase [Fulvitalea axinellae]|uniref:N-acetylmuramic acid 6-phosphate etherase n=1 Tax=Fulvitalea axinellae TaxID=1182444 RepID=A0AAU9D5S1_9BACT|nr:N-acetylmuramic acid 6-phosphate etherase [Fulvitalea axinellae]
MSTTEADSLYDGLEKMSTEAILEGINNEDRKVAVAVGKSIPSISLLVDKITERMSAGGRLFYIGAGTSGRLGVVDASECPPTFGVPHELVVGVIAGGDGAIRKAVEFAEDDEEQAWRDLEAQGISEKDCLVGIAASGRTPYVLGGLRMARQKGLLTGCVVCNEGSVVAKACEYPVEVVVGPEFVTGSTRMKAGTAQKMTLNMLTTSVMIKLGKVRGNKMVDMQLSNHKLVDRAVKMVMAEASVNESEAKRLLDKYGSVRSAVDNKE